MVFWLTCKASCLTSSNPITYQIAIWEVFLALLEFLNYDPLCGVFYFNDLVRFSIRFILGENGTCLDVCLQYLFASYYTRVIFTSISVSDIFTLVRHIWSKMQTCLFFIISRLIQPNTRSNSYWLITKITVILYTAHHPSSSSEKKKSASSILPLQPRRVHKFKLLHQSFIRFFNFLNPQTKNLIQTVLFLPTAFVIGAFLNQTTY